MGWYRQTILMKKYALFVSFEKISKIWNCRQLQIIGDALWVISVIFSCVNPFME